jgi:rSAM/selenodomain-associated transferase 1
MESYDQNTVRFPNQNRTLVIMAKAPRPGMVKTRLSQSLPLAAVTALYCCLLQDTVALAQSLRGVEVALMCPGPDVDELARLLGNAAQIVAQKGEGLAAGLTSVFAHFATTGQHHVIAFNSDSPHLPAVVLESAFQTLVAHDVVIGPTHDGGYYLVGANASHPTLFENDGMGTRSALDRLLARARHLDLSTRLTEPFYDIDVAEDLIQLNPELRLAPERAPRTASWFAEWGQAVAKLRPPIGEL